MSNVSVGSKTEAAGWGLISASFLTPNYDITFSMAKPAERYKRRRKKDVCLDQRDLPNSTEEPIFFFGGKDYVPLFCKLTHGVRGRRTVFFNSEFAPDAPGCLVECHRSGNPRTTFTRLLKAFQAHVASSQHGPSMASL